MARTHTGSIPIGIRCNIPHWGNDIDVAVRFASENDFEVLDPNGSVEPAQVQRVLDAGLAIGSIDLKQPWSELLSTDAGRRRAAADDNAQYIEQMAKLGVRNFFVVMFPDDPSTPRAENLRLAADGYGRLCDAIAASDARIVLEGWPGSAPHYNAFACTPESCRAVFDAVGSTVLGINFDPSHLIRMGIDPVRFLDEFSPRVYHAHGKDTELLEDDLYDFGNLQAATAAEPRAFAGHHWRYCMPGHGVARWGRLLSMLSDAGYDGALCIEHEDANFIGSPENYHRGLLAARDFLKHV